jgi:1-acyl-sn-glycerol-3-phosphate acyltransferase
MALIGILGFPIAMVSRQKAYAVIRFYCNTVFFILKYVARLKVEILGKIPQEPGIICAKHQSFLDVLMLASVLPNYRFIVKHQLTYLPVIGYYARRVGCVYVNREKKIGTTNKMIKSLKEEDNRQTVIYPQGTRVLPYAKKPYKYGAGLIYQEINGPCFLVAGNTGMFWARRSLYRYPGTAKIKFIGKIAPGLPVKEFMSEIETRIERSSLKLMDDEKNKT